MLVEIITIGVFLIIIGILLVKYLNGDFTYEEKIIEKREYRVTSRNWVGDQSVNYIQRILIERRYVSGKIKFITKEINI